MSVTGYGRRQSGWIAAERARRHRTVMRRGPYKLDVSDEVHEFHGRTNAHPVPPPRLSVSGLTRTGIGSGTGRRIRRYDCGDGLEVI